MSDFLSQLDELTEERGEVSQLYAELDALVDEIYDNIAQKMLDELKAEIMDGAKRGAFTQEDGKRILKGTHIYYTEPLKVCDKKLLDKQLSYVARLKEYGKPTSKYFGISLTPTFSYLGTHEEIRGTKKVLFFTVEDKVKYKKVAFRFDERYLKIIRLFLEKAKADGIEILNFSYGISYEQWEGNHKDPYQGFCTKRVELETIDKSEYTFLWEWNAFEIKNVKMGGYHIAYQVVF